MKTDTKEILLIIEEMTGKKFVECKDRKVTFLATGEEIPAELCLYQAPPKENATYVVSEYTCGDKCKIGEPSQGCIDRRIYCKEKCSVYGFRPAGSGASLTVTQVLNLVDFLKLRKETPDAGK